MKVEANNGGIETLRPKRTNEGQLNAFEAGYPHPTSGVLPGDKPAGTQEELEAMKDLIGLMENDPKAYESFMQMAADATILAEKGPEFLEQLLQETGTEEEQEQSSPSAARAEQKRAMSAAAELTGGNVKGKSEAGGGGMGNGINLPGGGTLGAGGVKEKAAGVVISPRPGFVLKTKLLDTGMKVFVNVCQHERIGESGMVKKLDGEGHEVEGLNIPMSVGPPAVDKDNAGQECIVYDVIINPKTVEECRKDKTGGQRDWVCHLAMQSVMSKHDCRLDPKYKLPKLTFKGDKEKGPAKQRIRDDSAKPRISELSTDPTAATAKTGAKTNVNAARGVVGRSGGGGLGSGPSDQTAPSLPLTSTITAVKASRGGGSGALFSSERGAEPEEKSSESDVSSTRLDETVRIPLEKWPDTLVVTAAGLRKEILAAEVVDKIGVQVSAYECTVKASGHHALQVRLPYAVLPDTASAQANFHEGTLVVSLLVDKSPPSMKADAGSKPWLLSSALEGGRTRIGDGGGDGGGTERPGGSGATTKGPGATDAKDKSLPSSSEDLLPEDRFHLRLPAGVNKYTGIAEEDGASNDHDLDSVGQGAGTGHDPNQDRIEDEDAPIAEGECLPEERFHKADIVSQHMIDTREKQRKEKIDRAEEEWQARKKEPRTDDGIEYVDFDDYRPGGKLGPCAPAPPPPSADVNAVTQERDHDPIFSQNMAAATRVLSHAVKGKGDGGSAGAALGSRLSSSFWAELLD